MSSNTKKIAICYDFDGTLAPDSMMNHHLLPDLDINIESFWKNDVQEFKNLKECDETLAYMYLMLIEAKKKGFKLNKNVFMEYGAKVPLFKGVDKWFENINKYTKSYEADLDVEHYLLSAGLSEMVDGLPIKNEFTRIYASKYLYDDEGNIQWPSYGVNFTSKTQFLFRIEKGLLDEKDVRKLNDISKTKRIPFTRIIFIGDGLTDVPCMKLVKDNGGYSIAVYTENNDKSYQQALKLYRDHRVDFFAPADYSPKSHLSAYIKKIVEKIITEEHMEDHKQDCRQQVEDKLIEEV